MVSVAIDGPAGAGKSTLARRLAAEMGYIYVDTGAMFRTIGLYALRKGVDPKDNAAVNTLLPEIGLRVDCIDGEQHIYLNGEDVSTAIRTEEAGMAASAVGANPEVRAFLLELQRGMTKTQNVLMDGRDIGTVVLPDATVKIFLTAAPEARARRRWLEYQQKRMEVAFEDVLADVKQRDYQDTHRAAAPLKQAEDAVLLDTSDLNFEQSLAAMKKIIAGGLPGGGDPAHLPGGYPRKRGQVPAAQERPVRHCGAGRGGCGTGAHPLRYAGREDAAVLPGERHLRRADARRPVRHGEPPGYEGAPGQ